MAAVADGGVDVPAGARADDRAGASSHAEPDASSDDGEADAVTNAGADVASHTRADPSADAPAGAGRHARADAGSHPETDAESHPTTAHVQADAGSDARAHRCSDDADTDHAAAHLVARKLSDNRGTHKGSDAGTHEGADAGADGSAHVAPRSYCCCHAAANDSPGANARRDDRYAHNGAR